jgi:hypothetical protein|tara:strand:- start:1015 stop:2652 length:1638 start_codon:yes stop_codon:yes gene_type:complete
MSTVNDNKTETKLDPRLDPKVCSFTDYSIDKYVPSFETTDEGGTITRDRVDCSLNVKGNSTCKGLKIRCHRKTGTKSFRLVVWLNGKSTILNCGIFQRGVYGVEEVEEYLKPIVKACREKGVWVKYPKEYLAEKKIEEDRIKQEEEDKERKEIKVKHIIEIACVENFPKTKQEGTVSASSLRVFCLYLIGYNKRTDHLIFTEDDEGNGLIRFKPEGPQSFPELFKMYPSGVGNVAYDPHKNPKRERSVYDTLEFANKKIIELLPGDIEDYVNKDKRSYGYKNNLLDTLSHLWSFARYHQSKPLGKNPPLNPCRRRDGGITIKKSRKSKFKGSVHNKTIYTTEQLLAIEKKLWTKEYEDRWDFRAMALLFICNAGKRGEETKKIQHSDIDYENEEVNLRLTKTRTVEKVDFDEDIIKIINKCKELRKKLLPKTVSIRSLKWLFISPIIDHARLHDDVYVSGHQTRLKRLDGCMKALKKDLKLPGSMKTFRKAFDTGAIHKAKLSAEEVSAVSGQSAETIRRSYDHPDKDMRKAIKKKIRLKVFNKA